MPLSSSGISLSRSSSSAWSISKTVDSGGSCSQSLPHSSTRRMPSMRMACVDPPMMSSFAMALNSTSKVASFQMRAR